MTFTRDEVDALAGHPPGLLDALAVCDRMAPILATAPSISGNPRIVKRLLNAITLRQTLAASRKMNVDLATLAKLAVFERGTDSAAAQKLYSLVMEEAQAEEHLMPVHKLEKKRPELPAEWKGFEPFIERWREMEPYFDSVSNLRPAVFLSRDVMATHVAAGGQSATVAAAVEALLATSVNSPAAKTIVSRLTPNDQNAAMGLLINQLREGDWMKQLPGVHGALVLAKENKDCETAFKAFTATLQTSTMSKPTRSLLQALKMIAKDPSWADQDPPPPGLGPPPPPPPDQQQLEPRRTVGFRRSLGEFYRTGEGEDARRALGHFSRGSFGGGGSAGQRFARAARVGGAAFEALSSAVSGQPAVPGGFDVASLTGRPVSEAIEAIVDAFCPPGILDEDAIRVAMNEALAEAFEGLDKFDPSALDAYATLVAVRCFVAELVFSTIMAEQGAAAADVDPVQAVARENDIRSLVRDTTDLQATPILQNVQSPMTAAQIEGLVKAIATAVGKELAAW